MPTRYSLSLISVGTPIRIGLSLLACTKVRGECAPRVQRARIVVQQIDADALMVRAAFRRRRRFRRRQTERFGRHVTRGSLDVEHSPRGAQIPSFVAEVG